MSELLRLIVWYLGAVVVVLGAVFSTVIFGWNMVLASGALDGRKTAEERLR